MYVVGLIPVRVKIFLFSTASIQPPIQWILRAISPGLKRPGCETYDIPPSIAKVKNGAAIPPLPIYLHFIVLN
jgi:hypothetical protein